MEQTVILLAEDEVKTAKIETSYLEKEGFKVLNAYDGQQAIELFESEPVDLVLLDLMMPKLTGEEVLTRIRAKSFIPVILITAKVEEDDRILGFQHGADDYITKPFSPREMVERVKAVLRRSDSKSHPRASIIRTIDGRLELDLENKRIRKDDQEINLTRNEFQIISTLFSNPIKTFTREEIISTTFGYDYDAYDRAIDTHIKNIRQKIEDNPKSPIYIKTVYGMGYKAGSLDEIKK